MHFCTRSNRLIKPFLKGIIGLALFCYTTLSFAQVQLNTSIAPISTQGTTTIEVTTQNFIDIVGMQFTVNWDPSVLEFVGFSTVVDTTTNFVLNETNINTGLAAQGELPVVWLSQMIQSVSLEDGATLFLLHFNVLSNVPSEIFFDGTPTPIEFITSEGALLTVSSSTNTIELDGRLLIGQVFIDENRDCSNQETEEGLKNWLVELNNGEQTFLAITDNDGFFNAYLAPNTYTITVIPPENNYWTLCEIERTVSITEDGEESKELFFAAQPTIECPAMTVNISTPFLRRCFENYYRIEYCNHGTAIAEDAYVLLELPTELSILSSPIDYSLVEDGVYRFDIGDVPINACEAFTVKVLLDCESTDLGQTHCVRANIFPNEICETDQLWSGASLDITSSCEGDSVRFDIVNIGEGDMGQATEYIVIQDMIMLRQSTQSVQLNSGETIALKLPANGATYRLEMPQVPFHPASEQISASLEGCGMNDQGMVSRGFINMFERSDESPFTDEDCQENIGAFDPNDKAGYPNGYGPKHFIDQNKQLTYHIRFQNTGTDTAFNIVILDTLSEHLDVSTFRPLAASHEYEVVIQKENILKYSFNDIQLVDSVKNEPLSHGFIRFSIDQQRDVPLGIVIENSAAIYFDFNKPVITNTTEHTLGKDFIEVALSTSVWDIPTLDLTLSPNPFHQSTIVQIQEEDVQEGIFLLYDMSGRILRQQSFQGNQLELTREGLAEGIYLFKILSHNHPIGRGKLMIQNN